MTGCSQGVGECLGTCPGGQRVLVRARSLVEDRAVLLRECAGDQAAQKVADDQASDTAVGHLCGGRVVKHQPGNFGGEATGARGSPLPGAPEVSSCQRCSPSTAGGVVATCGAAISWIIHRVALACGLRCVSTALAWWRKHSGCRQNCGIIPSAAVAPTFAPRCMSFVCAFGDAPGCSLGVATQRVLQLGDA